MEQLHFERVLFVCALPHLVYFRKRWLERGHEVIGEIVVVPDTVQFGYDPSFKIRRINHPTVAPHVYLVSDMLILESKMNDFNSWLDKFPAITR